MTFIAGIFWLHCKVEHKQIKSNQVGHVASDRIFPNLERNTVFEWLLTSISWYSLSQKWIINGHHLINSLNLKKIGHI